MQKKRKLRPGPKLRIEIAKDVLARLDAKKIVASPGEYLYSDVLFMNREKAPMETATAENMGVCQACVKGALFLSGIDRCNTLSLNEAFEAGSRKIKGYMLDVAGFSNDQMDLMETAFEGCEYDGALSADEIEAAVAFGDKAEKRSRIEPLPERRMRAIMRNVIKNNGTFKP